ncbi:MAG TPA: hypothetical protein VFV38_01350, partial [Ktedonobacteraceae bacterium]|nr:hypothetical protein [Ktedonobacteraceae bacterium]
MSEDLAERFEYLIERLRTAYANIGHSSGRPYIYFVYEPSMESQAWHLADMHLRTDLHLTFCHINLLPLTIASLEGQEEQRQALLNDPRKTNSAAGIVRLWVRRTSEQINASLEGMQEDERPVIVLRGLAALHPLGTPTSLMEFLAEHEPRHPRTNAIVPIVLLIPGRRPPQSS